MSSWKRILYVSFIILVAGFSALAGAFAGGLAVFTALQSQPQAKMLSTASAISGCSS